MGTLYILGENHTYFTNLDVNHNFVVERMGDPIKKPGKSMPKDLHPMNHEILVGS